MLINSTPEWSCIHWGILFVPNFRDEPPTLIGRAWLSPTMPKPYPEEPSRALLFKTRTQARAYCRRQHEKYKDSCPHWKFKPVKVRETVKICEAAGLLG